MMRKLLTLLLVLIPVMGMWRSSNVARATSGRPHAEYTRPVTLVFAGDAMQHAAQLDAARQADGLYDYSDCFTDIAPLISGADYAVVNLETPIGGKGPYTGYPCFYAPASFADALVDAGFDLMLTANNHTLDRHARGLRSTISELDRRGIPHLGTYTDKEARGKALPMIQNIGGIRVGFLNYTYGTNGIEPRDGVVVDYIDRQLIADDVAYTRLHGAEVIVVAVHWGDEYRLLPNASQRSLADYLTGLGVDMIIGGHPHVIQPMEMRYSAEYGKNILVVYSLGNFISNMRTRDTRGGALVRVTVSREADGRARVSAADYQLHFTVPPGHGRNFHVVPADEPVDNRAWRGACDAFTREAGRIFDQHNVGVGKFQQN